MTKGLEQVIAKGDQQTLEVQSAVKNAIENSAMESGQVTASRVVEIVTDFRSNIVSEVQSTLKSTLEQFQMTGTGTTPSLTVSENESNHTPSDNSGYRVYAYAGKFWEVPESWGFATMTIKAGWHVWVLGDLSVESSPVRPFRKLTALPKKVKKI